LIGFNRHRVLSQLDLKQRRKVRAAAVYVLVIEIYQTTLASEMFRYKELCFTFA